MNQKLKYFILGVAIGLQPFFLVRAHRTETVPAPLAADSTWKQAAGAWETASYHWESNAVQAQADCREAQDIARCAQDVAQEAIRAKERLDSILGQVVIILHSNALGEIYVLPDGSGVGWRKTL